MDVTLRFDYYALNKRLDVLEKANRYQRCDCMWKSSVGACRESFDDLAKRVEAAADSVLINDLKQLKPRLEQLEQSLNKIRNCEQWVGRVSPPFFLSTMILAISWFIAAGGR